MFILILHLLPLVIEQCTNKGFRRTDWRLIALKDCFKVDIIRFNCFHFTALSSGGHILFAFVSILSSTNQLGLQFIYTIFDNSYDHTIIIGFLLVRLADMFENFIVFDSELLVRHP